MERLNNFKLSLSQSSSLIVTPASKLTDSDRDYIRANKRRIVSELLRKKNFSTEVFSKNDIANVDMLPEPDGNIGNVISDYFSLERMFPAYI